MRSLPGLACTFQPNQATGWQKKWWFPCSNRKRIASPGMSWSLCLVRGRQRVKSWSTRSTRRLSSEQGTRASVTKRRPIECLKANGYWMCCLHLIHHIQCSAEATCQTVSRTHTSKWRLRTSRPWWTSHIRCLRTCRWPYSSKESRSRPSRRPRCSLR